jgi:hypothetical protein
MGLYLCVMDPAGDELEGVEIGSYSDFNFFRDTVIDSVEKGAAGSICPTLINHSDSDGEWSVEDAKALRAELDSIERVLLQCPPISQNSPWKVGVMKSFGINLRSLNDCFFDIDGEPLIGRIRQLIDVSVENNLPILFQ